MFNDDYLKGLAVINQEDPYGQKLIERVGADRVWTYSISDTTADLYTKDLSYGPTGVSGILCTPEGEAVFTSPLVGQFNLENLLAAVGSALHLGVPLVQIVEALPKFAGVPGRMERVQATAENAAQDISVIVDYAHTPDSLENALKAARPFINGQLICVFGCGGDRDRTKRPLMGRIAYEQADRAIVTSDNPRTEDPGQILQDVVAGIVIAGKGHEDYQILGTEKIHFDDREQSREALNERAKSR